MNYKHLFAIHKQLLKHEMPDDLIPLFFDYLGDLNETVHDMINQHCWWRITYDDTDFILAQNNKLARTWSRTHGGHYCTICDKIYDIRATWEFKQHCRGRVHKRNLEKDKNSGPPTKDQILKAMKHKYHSFYIHVLESLHRTKPKRQITTLLAEKINPFK